MTFLILDLFDPTTLIYTYLKFDLTKELTSARRNVFLSFISTTTNKLQPCSIVTQTLQNRNPNKLTSNGSSFQEHKSRVDAIAK